MALRIVHPVDDPVLRRAAALRLARTRKSLDWLLRRDAEALELFAEARGDQMIVAVDTETGRPVGMLTWRLDGRDVFVTDTDAFRAVYGWAGGTVRHWIYRRLRGLVAPSGLYVDAFWVEPAWRPRGAGMRLFFAVSHTITGRLTADIRRDSGVYRQIMDRIGLRPVRGGIMTLIVRAFGYVRVERQGRCKDGTQPVASYISEHKP